MFQKAKEIIVIPKVLKPKVVDGLPDWVPGSSGEAVDSRLFVPSVGLLLSTVVAIVVGVVGGGPLQ